MTTICHVRLLLTRFVPGKFRHISFLTQNFKKPRQTGAPRLFSPPPGTQTIY